MVSGPIHGSILDFTALHSLLSPDARTLFIFLFLSISLLSSLHFPYPHNRSLGPIFSPFSFSLSSDLGPNSLSLSFEAVVPLEDGRNLSRMLSVARNRRPARTRKSVCVYIEGCIRGGCSRDIRSVVRRNVYELRLGKDARARVPCVILLLTRR